VSLTAPDLTRQNLLDSPSAALTPGRTYWLVYATDNPVDLGAVADAITAATSDLYPIGGSSQTADGVVVPITIASHPTTTIVDLLVDPIKQLSIGTDLTLFGLGWGPSIGSGAVLQLQFMVGADLHGGTPAGGLVDQGGEILGAASQSGKLGSPLARTVASVRTAATSSVTATLSTVKLVVILLAIAAAIYAIAKLTRR